MPKIIFPITDPVVTVTREYDDNFLEFGPGAANSTAGLVDLQFNPTLDFVGSFTVMARSAGSAAKADGVPFIPVAYRRVNVAGAASDRTLVSTPIITVGMIEVPANGWSIAVLVACSAGSCQVFIQRLSGTLAL